MIAPFPSSLSLTLTSIHSPQPHKSSYWLLQYCPTQYCDDERDSKMPAMPTRPHPLINSSAILSKAGPWIKRSDVMIGRRPVTMLFLIDWVSQFPNDQTELWTDTNSGQERRSLSVSMATAWAFSSVLLVLGISFLGTKWKERSESESFKGGNSDIDNVCAAFDEWGNGLCSKWILSSIAERERERERGNYIMCNRRHKLFNKNQLMLCILTVEWMQSYS